MERQYLVTERAHFMCPNMHFGMKLKVKTVYNKQAVEETLNRMADAHPFLKSLIAYEDGTNRLCYKVTESSQIQLNIQQDEGTLWADYKNIVKQEWNVFDQGLLKVLVYPRTDGMTVLFVVHHLLVDGRGGLSIAEEFANDYVGNVKPVYVEEKLIQSIQDLPEQSSLAGMSKLLIKQANTQWKKENQVLNYEQYLAFVKKLNENLNLKYNEYNVPATEVTSILQLCHDNDFTMNDYLMACMYQKTQTKKIIIASDVRKKVRGYREGSYGNYATAMGIEYKGKTSDVVTVAKSVHNIVKKHMSVNRKLMLVLACYLEIDPTLLDASAISAMGGFESKAGKFVGGSMFNMTKPTSYSITNLGSVQNDNIQSLMFIPPASPAAKLTLGVVTINGEMLACSSEY